MRFYSQSSSILLKMSDNKSHQYISLTIGENSEFWWRKSEKNMTQIKAERNTRLSHQQPEIFFITK